MSGAKRRYTGMFKTRLVLLSGCGTTFLLLLAQQLIVASSTYFLAQAARQLSQGHPDLDMVGLYLASLILPYIPGLMAASASLRWELHLQSILLEQYFGAARGRLDIWRNARLRQERSAIVAQELPQTVQSWVQYVFDLVSTSLNVGLNVLTVSLIVDPRFAVSFVVSLFICTMAILLLKKRTHNLTIAAQDSRITFSSYVLGGAESVFIGNKNAFSAFMFGFKDFYARLRSAHLSQQDFLNLSSGLMVVLSFLPSVIVAWMIFQESAGAPIQASALLVTLPRLFMILNFTYSLIDLSMRFTSQRSRINGFMKLLSEDPRFDFKSQIQYSMISINEKSIDVSFIQNVNSLSTGRFTIRGENGSGKSAMLLTLKQQLGDRAIYVPASHEFDAHPATKGGSTGERTRLRLLEVLNQLKPQDVLLLDEWDANLDPTWSGELSKAINQASINHVIIEVRHRVS